MFLLNLPSLLFKYQPTAVTNVVLLCAQVRKQLRDMEAKVKDQEEELDEQAGTIQMLEQVETITVLPSHYI